MLPGIPHHDHHSHSSSRDRGCGSHSHGLQSHGSSSHCGRSEERDDGHRCGESRYGNSRLGENYGWGREGRVRLNPGHSFPSRRGSSIGGLSDGLSDLRLGSGGGGSLLSGSMDYPRRLGAGSGSLRRSLLDPRRDPYSDSGSLSSRLGSRDRLGPYMSGGLPIGLGSRSSSGSSGGSLYPMGHLDRRPRGYHYQPPHVEDDIDDILEEEMLRRRQDMARHGMADDLYGGAIFEDDYMDPRGRRGGL